MKAQSKIFDAIRVKPRRAEQVETKVTPCAWEGCNKPGLYKAPKGWRAAGEFHSFCLEHVRHYNKAFDYYDGIKRDKLDEILRTAAQTGDRPTWGMGANPAGKGNPKPRGAKAREFTSNRFGDPLNVFARFNRFQGKANPIRERERKLAENDRRALETLGLEGFAAPEVIKKAYKTLVKRHHPDANGGSKASEDRLRAIITAYTHLKQKGLV